MQLPARFGKYVLLKELELGGMAAVYLAKAHGAGGFEKLLAIKRIFPQLSRSEDFVEMFIAEARIASELNHPNISHIYDLGQEEGDYFIAMEYIHGKDAFRLLKRCRQQGRRIPLPLACYMTQQVLQGLDYAHRKRDHANQPMGIVHRDVSPRNVLISYEGNVKLIDFGIAKAASQNSHTQAGTIKGKIHYMSPEQSLGKPLDGRSDLFSAGLLLYELIFQARLFKGDTDVHTLELIRECSLPDFRQKYPELPQAVDEILRRALARDREQRFQTATQFIEAINRFLVQFSPMPGPPQVAELMSDVFGPEIVGEQRELEGFRSVRDDDTGRIRLPEPQLHVNPARQTVFGMVSGHVPVEALERAQALAEGDLDPGVTRIEPPPVREEPRLEEDSAAHPLPPLPVSAVATPAPAAAEPRLNPPVLVPRTPQKGPSLLLMGAVALTVLLLGVGYMLLRPSGAAVSSSEVAEVGKAASDRDGAASSSGGSDRTASGSVGENAPPSEVSAASPVGEGAPKPSSAEGTGEGAKGETPGGASAPSSVVAAVSSSKPVTSAVAAAPAGTTRPVATPTPKPTSASASRSGAEPVVSAAAAPESSTAPATPAPVKPVEPPPAPAVTQAAGGTTGPAAGGGGATSSGATSSGATSSGATSSGATSSGATSSGATSSGATSSGATSSGAASAPASVESRATGFLSVNAAMPCLVRIDGTPVGQTPLKAHKLSVGKHKVELERLSDKSARTYDVEVKANQVHKVLWQAGE